MEQLSNEQVVSFLSNMSVMDMIALVKELEIKWGVSSAPISKPSVTTPKETVVEQTEFNVVLLSAGEQKINAIKAIKDLMGLGLKEAKELTERTPVILKEGISKTEADEIKVKLDSVGAKIEIK
jgi:large subunit ribosomal protein L7/L12